MTSNVIVTGHEHTGDFSLYQNFTGQCNQYMCGGALQKQDIPSQFNALLVDMDRGLLSYSLFTWDSDIYKPHQLTRSWLKIPLNKSLGQGKYSPNEDFLREISDLGQPFKHPSKQSSLSLQDLYIYPDIELLKGRNEKTIIRGSDTSDYIFDNKYILILGPELSGKSALARKTFLDFLERDIVPIYVKGSEIMSSKVEKLQQLFMDTFGRQYSREFNLNFYQLPKNDKALVIDDFEDIHLPPKAMNELLCYVEGHFGRVIITTGNLCEIEEIIRTSASLFILKFKHCQIMGFGRYLQAQLIDRWLRLGQEDAGSYEGEAEIQRRTKTIQDTVNTIIGSQKREILPRYPFFLITVIQSTEKSAMIMPLSRNLGSFGQYYEWLVGYALSTTQYNVSDLGAKLEFLSDLAFSMLQTNVNELSMLEIQTFHQTYCKNHALRPEVDLPFDGLMKDLSSAGMILFANGYLQFRYHNFYYFAAKAINKKLQSKTTEDDMHQLIENLINRVDDEKCGYILLFLGYIAENPFVRQAILRNAKLLLAEKPLCDLNKDFAFINVVSLKAEFESSSENPKQAREEFYKQEDDIECNAVQSLITSSALDYAEFIDPEIRLINLGLRIIRIMGQILRNAAGFLEEQDKYELAEECYLLGLRILKSMLAMLEKGLPEFKEVIKQYLSFELQTLRTKLGASRKASMTASQLEVGASVTAFLYTENAVYLTLKILSYSVGLEKLEIIFAKLLENNDLPSVRIVDLSVKLESYQTIPLREIIEMSKELKNNPLVLTVLSHLVWDRIYFWGCKRIEVLQKISAALPMIKANDPRLLQKPQH